MPSDWLDIRTRRGRLIQYVSDACIVGACLVLAFVVDKHWSWGPFVVGPLVAVAGLGGYALLMRVAIAAVRPTAEQLKQARQGLRQRNATIVPAYLSFGVGVGLIAGSRPSYWPDVVLALMILVFGLLIPLAALPLLKRRAAAQTSDEPTGN